MSNDQGLLRYGRSAPDYRSTNSHSVAVRLPGGEADLGLLRVVIEEENRRQSPLPVDSLIALGQLRQERRLEALLNQGMKKITLKSQSFVDTGFYDGHI
ncbi:hypothetical protein Q5691_27380 [Microcoleus sp. w1-18aA5]|uniref:hypothetical protein n=1 Tax=Microcoleus sp. w1-18aA5 TaxID=2818982 RepID=UPI002FD55129